ncbi:hypothetical protein HMPREF0602_0016 [Neisseria meningitidis ATCC 13091]|uniref:Uncharacterized protein n=1 Tax=Neisseria meningitidis serogroup B (strain ATCC 13091 / M2091) TaxID=862513 RepID=E0N686_NEIM3|nr:hypothetical protein HMPREF0602_0016 [Neisseria meningitidis ATCC 13091]
MLFLFGGNPADGGITAGIGGFRAVLCVPPRVRKRIPVFPA